MLHTPYTPRRVIFTTLTKRARGGRDQVKVPVSLVKQIAGRAGRRNRFVCVVCLCLLCGRAGGVGVCVGEHGVLVERARKEVAAISLFTHAPSILHS